MLRYQDPAPPVMYRGRSCRDLGRYGGTECRERGGGGRRNQAAGNRVLHHRQAFLVSQEREYKFTHVNSPYLLTIAS